MNNEPQVIIATHYFSDCSMSNFWSTFRESNVSGDFSRISADGFNHIILIVPWAQFHERLDDLDLNPRMSSRLDLLINEAAKKDLKVIIRIGYLWENAPVRQRTFARYCALPTSKKHQRAWSHFCHLMQKKLSQYENFSFAFTSWEDYFWPLFRRNTDLSKDERLLNSTALGFSTFLEQQTGENSTIEAIPEMGDVGIWYFAKFFDQVLLEKFHSIARLSFPGLEYEGRIDVNPFNTENGIRTFPWTLVRNGYSRPVSYFHPNLCAKQKDNIDAEMAADRLQMLTNQYEMLTDSPHKVFIDQFNFVTKNPDYDHFISIDDSQLVRFIELATPIIKNRTSGYGIWGYRDWTNDKIFNGAFEFGDDGWTSKKCTFHRNIGCTLSSGSSIGQKIYQPLARKARIYLEYRSSQIAELDISIDGKESIRLSLRPDAKSLEASFQFPAKDSMEIECIHGEVTIERIGVFDHVFSSGMYHRDFSERTAIAAVRALNSELAVS